MGCSHPDPTAVTSTHHGETLAYLCPACDEQLPASFGDTLARRREHKARQDACEHHNTTEFTDWIGRIIARRCTKCGKPLTVAA